MATRPNSELMKKRRESLDLSQKDVAYRLQSMGYKISDNHYSRIERGTDRYSNPQIDTAFAIAMILKMPVDELFIFTPEKEADFSPTPSQEKKIDYMPQEVKERIGKQIRAFRKEWKISVKEMAEKAGLAPSYIYHLEKGYGSKTALEKVAKAYKIDIKELV